MKNFIPLLALFMAGCIGSGRPTPTPISPPPTDPPSATPLPTETRAAPELTDTPAEPTAIKAPTAVASETNPAPYPAAQAETGDSPYPAPVQDPVEFAGSDDLQIAGTLFVPGNAPQPWPAVLLLHMLGSSKEAWGDVPTRLAEAGYAVLAIDMRGHGETNEAVNWNSAAADHQGALDYLSGVPGVAGERIGIIGASIGANLALRAGADRPAIRTVVLLSPGLDYAGVTTGGALADYGDRPILIVASSEDSYAATSSETLAGQAKGEARLVMYQGAGHGTNMFTREPGLVDTLIEWLDQFTR